MEMEDTEFPGFFKNVWNGGGGRRRDYNKIPYLVLFALIGLLQVPCSHQKGSSPSSSNPTLLFANRRDIRLLDFYFTRNPNGNPRGNNSILVHELVEAIAVDVHYEYGLVCWADIKQEQIKCSSFDNSVTSKYVNRLGISKNEVEEEITIVADDLPAPEDLACDFITSNLYFSDSENNRIEVVSMQHPYHRKVLVWDDIDQPRGIALAVHKGYMFFTDWGDFAKVERVDLDGKHRKVIVDKNIYWPNGITVDPYRNHVYWVDAKLQFAARVDFDGLSRKTLNEGAVSHPFAVTYYSDFLYYSDWSTGSIHFIRADGRGDPKTIMTGTKLKLQPMDVVVFEEQKIPTPVWDSKYPNQRSPCDGAKCSDLCLLSSQDPFYTCACPVGIKLIDGSNTQCSKTVVNFLLVARGIDIRRISLDTDDYTDLVLNVTNTKHVLAVDYHVKSGFLFWSDDEATGIRRAKLDGSEQQDIVKEEIVHPDGLAIDWIAENLYWTDAGTDRIEVARLDGSHRKILISRGFQEPRAVRVDPIMGLLFWSDWGKKPKIERSYLDGSSRMVLVNQDIYWPNGIALDLETKKVYFSDAKTDRIEVINYDGSDRQELVSDDLPHIFGFAMLGPYLFWTDWQRRTLERANKTNGGDRIAIKDPFVDPMGLIGVNTEDKVHNATNACSYNNGGCQHLCLYKPLGPVCACASGYELSTDNRSCLVPDAFLVFSRDGDLHRISLNRTSINNFDDIIPVSKVKAASALDFDTIENRIYWSDTKAKAISRAFMNGSDTEKIIEFGLVHPEGIAVDWLSRNIYWSDMGRDRIEVAKLNGTHRRTILWTDIDSPRSIALQPSKGYIYFTLWRSSNPSIEKAALDGSRRSVFIDRDIGRANGLTIDLDGNDLYWTDIDSMIIEKASLHDPYRTRQVVQKSRELFQPFSLAQYQDFIYFSDMATQSIWRANKSGDPKPVTVGSASNVVDMAIYHNLKQQGWNPCATATCSHLCFSIPTDRKESNSVKAKCGCPTHYVLSADGNNCTAPEEYLLFSAGSTISRLIFDTSECPDAIVIGGQQQKRGIGAVAWDVRDRNIYWIDPKASNIKRASDSGMGATFLLNSVDNPFKPFDLVFDEVTRLLFWTCENYNSINVTDETGKHLGSVLSPTSYAFVVPPEHVSDDKYGSFRPRNLALNVQQSHLYFSNDGRIERIRLDGMEHKIISNSGTSISGLAVDLDLNRLYWTDAGPKRIEYSDLEGKNRQVLIAGLDSPASISVMGRYVYWIEERSGVERVEKWNGDERQRVLTRIENAKYITLVNESLVRPLDNCRSLHCSHVCLNGECSCFEGFVLSFEDHQTCIPRPSCVSHEFSCSRGRVGCIPLPLKCNGANDCADGSDELGCEKDFECPCEGHCFKKKYISKFQLCDGKEDCFGTGWDESREACEKLAATTEFQGPEEPGGSWWPVVFPLLILVLAILMALVWYFRRSQPLPSEESTEPLNHPGTNMTTVHTTETLRQYPSTNGSSIGSSPYCELLVPHPSPATDVRSFCCHGNYAVSYYNRMEPAPPPTPCSTDVCDNSEIYAFAPPPSPHTSSPHSTIRSYYPPPPSPNLT